MRQHPATTPGDCLILFVVLSLPGSLRSILDAWDLKDLLCFHDPDI
jgi:hypothetical protein